MFSIVKTSVFDKWLKKFKSQRTKAIITDHIIRMTDGNLGLVKNVGEGVFEKKINYGGGFRLYYFLREKSLIILLCGGDKSTQKHDIEQAKKIKKGLL